MALWLKLAGVFVTLSLFSFGGGNAVIPALHADAVERYHWISSTEFSRMFALARLVPGPTLSMATLIGYGVAGVGGAIVATLAMFVPAGIVMFFVAKLWHRAREHPWRDRISAGVKPVVLGLVWAAVPAIARGAIDVPVTIVVAIAATLMLLFTRIPQVVVIAGGGLAGFLFLR